MKSQVLMIGAYREAVEEHRRQPWWARFIEWLLGAVHSNAENRAAMKGYWRQ